MIVFFIKENLVCQNPGTSSSRQHDGAAQVDLAGKTAMHLQTKVRLRVRQR